MAAVLQSRYGDPHDVLHVGRVARPEPGPGELLVRVNTPDWATVTGVPAVLRLNSGLRRPAVAIRGTDVAGVVEAIGEGVDGFAVGDEVFGSTSTGSLRRGHGTFADAVLAPADQLAPKPPSITFEHAAAAVMSGVTALVALTETVDVRAGTRVLINGSSGGLGTFAVQIAASRGADVTAVTSRRNAQLVASLGADTVVAYDERSFLETDERYDVVLDNVMNHPPRQVLGVLAPGGVMLPNSIGSGSVLLGGLPRLARAMILGIGSNRIRTTDFTATPERLAEIGRLLALGEVRAVIDSVHSLGSAADAVARMLTHRAVGNVMISPQGDPSVAEPERR